MCAVDSTANFLIFCCLIFVKRYNITFFECIESKYIFSKTFNHYFDVIADILADKSIKTLEKNENFGVGFNFSNSQKLSKI